MPPHAARTIFVANIPYDVSEEQLAGVFSEAGPVTNVEIKFDPQTGRSKGYAFVQFVDEATASSAVRNLQEVPVNGRNLRVEASTDEPGPRRRQGGGGGGGGGGFGGRRTDDTPPPRDYGRPAPVPGPGAAPGAGMGYEESQPRLDLNLLPVGTEPMGGQKATDAISKTLAAVSPGQMQDVMAGMKTLVTTQPDQARQLLQSKPQLAYALFQAMLLLNIVDPSVLQRIQPLPPTAPPTQSYQPPNAYPTYPPPTQTQNFPPYPPAQSNPAPPPYRGGPPAGSYPSQPTQASYPVQGGYPAPPAQPQPPQMQSGLGIGGLPPHAQAAIAGLPEDQRAMLVQVLSLTPDQIHALDPQQRESIVQLRQQFLGTA